MWILDELEKRKKSGVSALVTREATYTFADIWNYSEKIACDIASSDKKTPVVLYGDKHPDMIPTMMASLKTGRAYVPVDITYPVERLKHIVKTVDACVIYNFSGIELEIPGYTVRDAEYIKDVLYKKADAEDISNDNWVNDEDDCYILFTSGSTGEPKGVPISKKNILNFLNWHFQVIDQKSILQNVLDQPAYSFDASVHMIYGWLAAGRTLVCVDKKLYGDTDAMLEWIRKNDVSLMTTTPAFVGICNNDSAFCEKNFPSLRCIMTGGEILSKNLVRDIWQKFPNLSFYNAYGPTEATVSISTCLVNKEMMDDTQSFPIGKILPEADYYIEDENGRKCTDGEVGELVVISKSVSRGYYNNPEKTAESFFCAEDGRMGYRTGDLVYQKNGLIYFVSRKDFQIKLSGYRIEIDDISTNLNKIPFVFGSVVLPAYGEDGKVEYLAGFVVLRQDHTEKNKMKNVIAIKKQLRELVPSYMVPQKIIILDEFPLNVNGKVDRKELAKLLDK